MARLGDVIARLAVNLSLETAAFEKGATKSEKRLNRMKRQFGDFSKSLKLGAVAIGGALVGLNKIFGDLADKSRELGNAAQVAGEGFEEFQRGAFAAKSVGIEFDKFGDILKDVRDRIGDFTQTGGGPMADFFENIAPKVGVTAKQFEGLGGKDALQLYYDSLKKANVSQEEMVFYLEAMASDATALIPLLENSGQAFDELGGKAAVITDEQREDLKRYSDAMLQVENALQRVVLALVDSGMIDQFADLAVQLAAVVEGFTGVEAAARATESELRKTDSYRQFGKDLRDLNSTIQNTLDSVEQASSDYGLAMNRLYRELGSRIQAELMRIADWVGTVKDVFVQAGTIIANTARGIYTSVKTWLTDKLEAVMDRMRGKIREVEEGFAWLYDRVVGNSWIPDMVDEVGQNMGRLQQLMVDPAVDATRRTDDAFRAMAGNVSALLDRLFPKVARLRQMRDELALLDEARAGALLSEDTAAEARRRARAEARGAVSEGGAAEPSDRTVEFDGIGIDWAKTSETVTEAILKDLGQLGDKARDTSVRVVESFKDMAQKTIASLQGLYDAIKGGGFLDILGAVVDIGLQLAGAGAFGKNVAAKVNRVPGYATGTPSAASGLALVGERGPELVRFRGGERVFNNADSRAMMGGGKMQIEVVANNNGFGAIVRDISGQVVAEAAPSIARQGAGLALQQARGEARRRIS